MRIRGFLVKKPKVKEIMESSFQTLIKKAIDEEGGTVSVYRYDPESANGSFASKIAPFDSDVRDWKDRDVSSYLNTVHGGGRYRVQVNYKRKDGSLVEAKTFDYSIGGEPKEGYYESKKTKQAEAQQVTDIFKTAMEFAKDVKGGDGGNATLITALMAQNTELQKQNSQNMMEMQKQYNQLVLKVSLDKEAGGGLDEMISTLMHMEEFKSTLIPKVEQNETLEMVKAAVPLVSALIASKSGIPLPQPETVQMIEASPPGTDTNLGSSPPANLTPAGSVQQTTPYEIKIPNGTNVKRDEFEIVMLDPLVDQIDSGATPTEIANLIQMIVSWSFLRAKSGVEPHSSVIGMVQAIIEATQGKADMTAIEQAYTDFVTSIEMPQELIEPVKQELLKIYMPLLTQATQSKTGGVENATTAT